MQIKRTEGGEYQCWLSEDEATAMITVAENRSRKHHVVVAAGLRMGLRANEFTVIRPCDMHEQASAFFLRVRDAKDTRADGSGKSRDAYLPRSVEHLLLRLQSTENISDDELFFPVHTSRIRQMVREIANDVADDIERYHDDERDGGTNHPGRAEDWRRVSSHDLRRFFAQTALRRKEMDAAVVMDTGGWDSMEALSPYLTKPTPEEVAEEFAAAGWD